jgi:hypothetical protein
MCPDPTPVPAAALYVITMQVSVSAPYEYNCIVVTMFIIVTKLADIQLGNTPCKLGSVKPLLGGAPLLYSWEQPTGVAYNPSSSRYTWPTN